MDTPRGHLSSRRHVADVSLIDEATQQPGPRPAAATAASPQPNRAPEERQICRPPSFDVDWVRSKLSVCQLQWSFDTWEQDLCLYDRARRTNPRSYIQPDLALNEIMIDVVQALLDKTAEKDEHRHNKRLALKEQADTQELHELEVSLNASGGGGSGLSHQQSNSAFGNRSTPQSPNSGASSPGGTGSPAATGGGSIGAETAQQRRLSQLDSRLSNKSQNKSQKSQKGETNGSKVGGRGGGGQVVRPAAGGSTLSERSAHTGLPAVTRTMSARLGRGNLDRKQWLTTTMAKSSLLQLFEDFVAESMAGMGLRKHGLLGLCMEKELISHTDLHSIINSIGEGDYCQIKLPRCCHFSRSLALCLP